MSEYSNTLGNPVLQEDVSSRSLHVSDLSPTSELLLSPHFHTDRAHHIRKSYENDTVSPMESHFKRPDFNSTNGSTRVNPARQYNDLQTTDDPSTKEKPRKAFSHEKLYPKRHKPSTTPNGQPRTYYTKQDGPYRSFGRETPGALLNSTSFRNAKPSSSVKLDKTLQRYSFQSSDAKNSYPYSLSGDRYSSLISKNNFNGGHEKDGDFDNMVPRDQTSKSKFSYMFDGEFAGKIVDGESTVKMVDGESTGKMFDGESTGEMFDGEFTGEMFDGKFTGKMVDGEFTGEIVDGEFTGEMFDGEFTGETFDGEYTGKTVDGKFTDEMFDGKFTGEMFDGSAWGLSSGVLDENKVNGHSYASGTLNGVPKDNGGFNVVPSKNRNGKNHGVTFDGDQRYGAVISNGMNGDMASKRSLSGGPRLRGMVNGRIQGGTNYHGYRDVLSNGHINGVGYGDFYSDGVHGSHSLTPANDGDRSESKTPSGLFEAATETTESILSQIFGRNNANRKERMTSLMTENASNGTRDTSSKPVDLGSNHDRTVVSKDLPYSNSLVQTNVVHYYDKLKKPGSGETLGERGRDVSDLGSSEMVSRTRRGMRSKSSELPLRRNTSVSTSHGLSKSWGSSKTRQEFQAIRVIKMQDGARENSENLSQRERVAKMFRIEEETALRRAQEFQTNTLLKKVFTAWHVRTRGVKISVDQLWKTHLLRKGMNGLKCAIERQGRAVVEFQERNGRTVLRKCWQMWQHQTRENQRKKMQDTFTQWHYYKLHMEREKLLETIANKHILSRNYLKWKTLFNAKQKNSIATVHFKINLIYKYWQCWILYNNQRRVKNHMKSIACYRYGERTRRRLFKEWKDRTEKSLLCKRLARRRVLRKAFFYWKHWTQYAKIVHLRLQNMCKEYHKRCMMTRTFMKWRQALRVKQSIAFWKKNQLRRTLKLWKLRLMRKKIHKHLCKALAKKAKKRRFFEKWTHFIEVKKQTRSAFAKRLQAFHVRTLFNCWRNQVVKENGMRKSLCTFQDESSRRLICQSWESWRFQLKIFELRTRSKNKWSLGCVRKCCEVWKLKVRKQKLGIQLEQNRSVCEVLVVKRFFRIWRDEYKKVRVDYSRSLYVATILKKNSLARIFQAWRVVNQEECIIESLVRRRERKEMARVYDAWRLFLFRVTFIRRRQNLRTELVKRKTFELWRHKLWSITKAQEVKQALVYSKLKRNFLAWMDYVKDVRFAEKMREQKSADMMRNFVQKWKQTAERKVETRDREKGEKAYRRVLLVSFFAAWQRKTKEHVQKVTSLSNMADMNRKQNIMDRSLKRWMRQYTIEIKTREYLKFKSTERLRIIFLTWKDFASDEFERQVYDFATNIALDSSSGSMLLSTSGYQTSLKNSTASFQFLPGEEETFVPVLSPRFRPLTPARSLDGSQDKAKPDLVLPSYRPVTTDRQQLFPGYQTPPLTNGPQSSCCHFPLTKQHSIDQLSQAGTSPQQSSEDDDGVPSSGVHSAGEESDQDDRTSIHVPESLCSFQTTSDGLPRDRELLVAETIIHWRSLSLSVAFRSWYKYTHHATLVRTLFADCVANKRSKLLTKMIGKWRRWLFVTVLARQHWLMHLQKKFLIVWVSYRKQRILNEERKEEAAKFSKKLFLQRFFMKWKNKKTTKCQLQSIVGRWQKNAVVTDVDKVVIQQFQEREQAICLRQTFLYWKKMTYSFQQASRFCQSLLLRRCLNNWRDAASYRTELKKKVDSFRNSHLIAKTFKEWISRYEDNRTAKILLGASEERKTEKTFKAWRTWASASSFRRKTSLAYRRAQEHNKLKHKFVFWFSSANKRIAMKNHYNKSLQRRILKSWRNVLTTKANTSGSIQDFQKIVQRNTLQTWFMFWRRRAQHNQLLSEYLKQQTKRKLTSAFGRWRQQKRKSEAGAHYSKRLKKKMFTSWCQEISKRKKARQHFKYWHTIAEGTKELNQVADIVVQDSENKLLRMKFLFWKKSTRHAQVAKYHHSTKLSRRFFIAWHDYTSNHKRLSLTFKEFQASHQRSNMGLLGKYMKVWKMKSTFSKQAEQLSNYNMSSKYWKVWRHNFVRRRVSSAMVEHDNKKILSKVFISWYNVTSSHKQLTKEVEIFRMQRWFRHWMARYNNS